MALIVVNLPILVMTAGTAVTQALTTFDDAYGLTFYAPSTFTSTSMLVEVEPSSTGTAWVTLQSGAVDVEIPAGKATVLSPVPFQQIRLHGSANEATTRSFSVTKVIVT